MELALKGILGRAGSLGIRQVICDILIHPRRDPGVLREAQNFLKQYATQYQYARVMFDREGCGRENDATTLEKDVKNRLDQSGWQGRAEVVVIDPELEVWVFADSPHVADIIAAGDQHLYEQKLSVAQKNALGKPVRPKGLMEEILRERRIPRSSSLYLQLAQNVSFLYCKDPSFCRLRDTLQKWFKSVTHR